MQQVYLIKPTPETDGNALKTPASSTARERQFVHQLNEAFVYNTVH